MKNNIDGKLREILFWHTAKIVNIEEEGGKTDNEDKEKCDIYKDTISAIKSLFPQELEEKEVSKILQDTKYIGMVRHYNVCKEWADKMAHAICEKFGVKKIEKQKIEEALDRRSSRQNNF